MPTVPELDEPPLAVTGAQRGPNLWLIVLLLLACFGIGGGIAAWFWLRARAPIASEPDAAASVPVAVGAADAAPVLAADAAPAIAADAASELPPVVSTALTDALAPVADAATDAASPDAASPDAALDALAAEPAKKPAAEKPAPRPQRAPKAKPRPPKSAEPCGTFINPCK
jgi:hypothetical protein